MTATTMDELITVLKHRFEKNSRRHQGIDWSGVQARLEAAPHVVQALLEMEGTGGEPDVIAYDKGSGEYTFCDCSPESPGGRRSLCFDEQALESRKENKPAGSATAMAKSMGVSILTEDQYRALQQLGEFDRKTSSWIQTPVSIRKLGGALFCDRRYDHVFTYHNGAESYYAARGFRALIKV